MSMEIFGMFLLMCPLVFLLSEGLWLQFTAKYEHQKYSKEDLMVLTGLWGAWFALGGFIL